MFQNSAAMIQKSRLYDFPFRMTKSGLKKNGTDQHKKRTASSLWSTDKREKPVWMQRTVSLQTSQHILFRCFALLEVLAQLAWLNHSIHKLIYGTVHGWNNFLLCPSSLSVFHYIIYLYIQLFFLRPFQNRRRNVSIFLVSCRCTTNTGFFLQRQFLPKS